MISLEFRICREFIREDYSKTCIKSGPCTGLACDITTSTNCYLIVFGSNQNKQKMVRSDTCIIQYNFIVNVARKVHLQFQLTMYILYICKTGTCLWYKHTMTAFKHRDRPLIFANLFFKTFIMEVVCGFFSWSGRGGPQIWKVYKIHGYTSIPKENIRIIW